MRNLLATTLILVTAALPALAQPASGAAQSRAANACRASCAAEAASRPGLAGRDAAAACTVRCGATTAYLAQQNRRGTAEASGLGQAVRPVATAAVPATPRQPTVVIYAGRSPARNFGIAVARDRLVAHREAQMQCGDGACRPLVESPAACGAVAQGVHRSPWALMMTSDPSSYTVSTMGGGAGASRAEAEQQAVADCRIRDPRATCRIVASSCGARL
jgi:hypothetical protein